MSRWNLAKDLSEAEKVVVFSGGACNIRDGSGHLLRNAERDPINDWLTRNDILFFDPQIHPDTHGTTYDYETHHPMEVSARHHAQINLFEISPRTFGGATSLEIAVDEFRFNDPTIIYFSDGNHARDMIPAHTGDGYPVFEPYGLRQSDAARMTHYNEYVKTGNRMRKYLMKFAEELNALTVTFGEEQFEGDVVIAPTRLHATDMFKAVVKAATGHRTIINFMGGSDARDENGYPVFVKDPNPLRADIQSALDEYVDEANALRKAIAELVRINVFSRVVYTQRAAKMALEDMMRVKGIREDFKD